jgi:putative Mn2+ efflux pump MntP
MQSTDKMSVDRSLRILTYLTTAIALPLNIAATVLSLAFQRHRWARRHVTAFCFIYVPLVMTVVASTISLLYMRKHGKSPRALHYKVFELVSVLGYIAVLIPCWSLEIREFSAGGFGLLVGYLTAPMILNM